MLTLVTREPMYRVVERIAVTLCIPRDQSRLEYMIFVHQKIRWSFLVRFQEPYSISRCVTSALFGVCQDVTDYAIDSNRSTGAYRIYHA